MSESPTQPKKTKPISITMPGNVSRDTGNYFVKPLESTEFFGRPSKSMVIRALCELAIEQRSRFDPTHVRDYESLKEELRRLLASNTEG